MTPPSRCPPKPDLGHRPVAGAPGADEQAHDGGAHAEDRAPARGHRGRPAADGEENGRRPRAAYRNERDARQAQRGQRDKKQDEADDAPGQRGAVEQRPATSLVSSLAGGAAAQDEAERGQRRDEDERDAEKRVERAELAGRKLAPQDDLRDQGEEQRRPAARGEDVLRGWRARAAIGAGRAEPGSSSVFSCVMPAPRRRSSGGRNRRRPRDR